MEFLAALASLAQQHPSTPLQLEVAFVEGEIQTEDHWESVLWLNLGPDESWIMVAGGEGATAQAALDELHSQLKAAPIR